MIGFRVKKPEWNTRPLLDATDRANLRALKRFGAFVMTKARQSIKKAPKTRVTEIAGKRRRIKLKSSERIAPAGQPPYSHKGTLKRFIKFAATAKSVVIGPERLPGKIGDAPAALEHSGPSEAIRGRQRKLKTTRVRQHPYMLPAFEKELPNAPKLWKDQIR